MLTSMWDAVDLNLIGGSSLRRCFNGLLLLSWLKLMSLHLFLSRNERTRKRRRREELNRNSNFLLPNLSGTNGKDNDGVDPESRCQACYFSLVLTSRYFNMENIPRSLFILSASRGLVNSLLGFIMLLCSRLANGWRRQSAEREK